ncbi:MAG: glycosyltransferase family 4 protein [Deltaproteobacteria bacterium]|nr:glycosyltransferase family 4 protein [Deltaproteobacteria bacterium]MBW2074705.1 glycosyltransferase family 4 protein [Deltaproteobacteria bacterium]
MKVLISAYACEPNKGSEPGVGWNWVKQIARFHEVWVITRANNREPIELALAKEPMPNVQWIYFDLPRWAQFWKRGQRGVHLYYYLWQISAYFVGKGLHKEVGFDLVHHVTFGTYWMPSFLVLLPVPFMWGPLGGGESAPMDFYKTFGLRSKMYELSRSMARWIGEKDPFVRLGARRAKIVLAKARETAERLRVLCADKVQLYSESGIAEEEFRKLYAMPLRSANPFRVVSIGRLLHWKGFHLGLRAFSWFQQEFSDSEYWFIGDGPERRNLQRLAHRLGVSDRVRFWGSLPREQVLEKLAECDVLVHPSLHDSGGWVCLEAMAAGRPVICLDLGGPALQVTEETGFKVPAISPEQSVRELAEAMCRLSQNPTLRARMGKAARKRVAEYFDWNKKGEWIHEVYQRVSRQCC